MYSKNFYIVLITGLLFVEYKFQIKERDRIGKFNKDKDLYLAHFDCKTDVDDIHSIAGVATIL